MKNIFRMIVFPVLIFVLLFSLVPLDTEAASSKRIKGDTRIGTAVELSKEGWSSSNSVILARSDEPADALASAGLVGKTDAPVLLTKTSSIDTEVLSEIKRLNAKNVYILGGTKAISNNVKSQLANNGLNVTRVSGDTRYSTAAEINKQAGLSASSTAIIANGQTVADALSASSIAANKNIPIYLSRNSSLPSDLPGSVKKVIIFGGSAAISDSLESSLKSKGITTERINGSTRYETSVNAAKWAKLSGGVNLLARGTSTSSSKEDYPDAVAAVGLGNKIQAPIVLTPPDSSNSTVKNYISSKPVYVLGGSAAVSDSALSDLGVSLSGSNDSSSEEQEKPSDGKVIETGTVVNVSSALNVRNGPSGSDGWIGSLAKGEKVDIYDITSNNWAKINYNGSYGYVSMSYIDTGKAEEKVIETGTVDVSYSLNVRSGPSGSDERIGYLLNGQTVEIYEISDNWAKIKYGDGYGYISMSYINTGSSASSALDGKLIAVDPGHGGKDPGATANGVQEKDIVLSVGSRLEDKLEAAGAEVVMTRSNDTFVELRERANIANRANADSFVSIHANAVYSNSVVGQETFYYPGSEEGEELAEAIQSELIKAVGSNDRGTKDANFSVLRNTAMPASLVELGFVTNEKEAKLMKTSEFQNKAATAIYKGIEKYHEEN